MKLYFTRHGESEANRLKVISNRSLEHPLTETGRQQAEALALRLRGFQISRIYASPILRARQTGEILATRLTVPLDLVEGLREPDCGIYEGRGDEEAWAGQRYWLETWLAGEDLDQGPPEGETYEAVRGRFCGFVQGLVSQYGDSPNEFVLVTHGEAMLIGLPALVSTLEAGFLLKNGLAHTGLLVVEYMDGELVHRETQGGD